jgi:hypothetical protein
MPCTYLDPRQAISDEQQHTLYTTLIGCVKSRSIRERRQAGILALWRRQRDLIYLSDLIDRNEQTPKIDTLRQMGHFR